MGVEGDLTFIFTIVGDVSSSLLTLNPSSQYFICHQWMPAKPLSIRLNLWVCHNSLFNCFNTPALSLILLIHLALDSSSFILLHSAKSSSSRSVRSYDIMSGWISWTTSSGSQGAGEGKEVLLVECIIVNIREMVSAFFYIFTKFLLVYTCKTTGQLYWWRWTIGSGIAMFHFLEWVFIVGLEQRMSTIGHWIWVKDLNHQTQDIWRYFLTIFEVRHCDRELIC